MLEQTKNTTEGQKIRVGFFTYGMGATLTGIGRYALELSYALQARYPQLDIILISPYPDSKLSWYQDFEVYHVPPLKRLPSVLTFGSFILAKVARQMQLDILHDPCGIAPFFGRWPERTRRIVTVHDAIPLRHPEYQPWMTRLVFGQFLPRAKNRTDRLITVSDNARDDLVSHLGYLPEQVAVTYPGVRLPSSEQLEQWREEIDAVRGKWGISRDYFLFVSAVSPRKNVPRLLEAFSQVNELMPNTSLILAGPTTPEISAIIQRMGIAGKSVFTLGYVDELDLHRLYTNARAVVYPSLYEGFGLPALEAMAHGTPIISSNTSSLPEVVGEAGWLIDPTDSHALARAMVEVLRDPDARKSALTQGRQRAANFSWEATASAAWDVYQRVLNRHRGI